MAKEQYNLKLFSTLIKNILRKLLDKDKLSPDTEVNNVKFLDTFSKFRRFYRDFDF